MIRKRYTDLMKLHYAALRKHVFVHGHFIYTNFEVKGFLFLVGVGGISSLPDGINGVSGIGVPCLWGPPFLAGDLDS